MTTPVPTPAPAQRPGRRRRPAPRLALLALLVVAAIAGSVAIAAFAAPARPQLAAQLRYPWPPSPSERSLDALEREIAIYRQRSLDHPEDGLDLAALADAYLSKARISGFAPWYLLADQSARRSLANLPFGNVEARLVLAEIAEARHDFGEARTLADGVLVERPGTPRALAIRTTVELARGRLDVALADAGALVATRPTPANLGLLALVQAARADDAEAVRTLTTAIAREERGDARTSAWLRAQLAREHLRFGRLEQAEPLLLEALRIVPGYPLAQLELAAVQLARGRARTAERSYAALLAGNDQAATVTDHAALQGMARARALRGDRPGADALWSRAEATLRADRERDAFGHDRELARLLLERGRPADLPEALELLRAETDRRRDAETLDLLAWALTRSGRLDAARTVAAEALALGSTPSALERAARIARSAGDSAAADRLWARLQAVAPDFDARTWRALGHADAALEPEEVR